MEAVIQKSTGSFYLAKSADGRIWQARIRGRLKFGNDISSTNPVAVGDKVKMDIEDEAQAMAVIREIIPRDNYMVRTSPHNKNQRHIIAANLDQSILIATVAYPRTSTGFIDRFLVTAEAYHIPVVIIFNKTDLLDEEGRQELAVLQHIYTSIGYQVLAVSAVNESDIDRVKAVVQGKISLFSGHSGVGKSTLLNALMPAAARTVNTISGYSGKGQHTTTFAEMFELPSGGEVIDTPGVKEFGIVDMDKAELSHYFPEMRALIHQCKFNNCLHLNEPGCAVKEAVEKGFVAPDRYINYLNILESL